MNWEDYGSENKDRVLESERMIRRDEASFRVTQDQALRRKRERLIFGLSALLATAIACGVVLHNSESLDSAVSTALRQSANHQHVPLNENAAKTLGEDIATTGMASTNRDDWSAVDDVQNTPVGYPIESHGAESDHAVIGDETPSAVTDMSHGDDSNTVVGTGANDAQASDEEVTTNEGAVIIKVVGAPSEESVAAAQEVIQELMDAAGSDQAIEQAAGSEGADYVASVPAGDVIVDEEESLIPDVAEIGSNAAGASLRA